MTSAEEIRPAGIGAFRLRLLLGMMVVVVVLSSLGIYVAQRRVAEYARSDFQLDFQLELNALHRLEDLRTATVADRSRSLAQNPRIHAALEDNALDLLYPSAKEELRDLMERPGTTDNLHAQFYRFLDSNGAVLTPPTIAGEGALLPNEERKLALPGVPQKMQIGYVSRRDKNGATHDEMIAVPIRSTETNEVIAALVLGFKPVEAVARDSTSGIKSGILVGDELQLAGFDATSARRLSGEVRRDIARTGGQEHSLPIDISGLPHLLFFKLLNPQSQYPPAYEVCVYPLQELLARERRLRTKILGAGAALMLGGFIVSEFVSRRLSQPVEQLAVVSEENFAQRRRAEAKLLTTADELRRSARFSADASHQLKSPITVLRVGLDSLLAREDFSPEVYEEISSLIHQTYRLTGVIDDLLLLSRMDAGKLQLNLREVDLTRLLDELLDDLQAIPEAVDLRIENELPPNLRVVGEEKYTALIVQNLLDNARKYNRRDGVIRICAREENAHLELRVANTGRGIAPDAQPYVFERFHRAGQNDVPGHGLGLNLARELSRLHGGELRLVRADAEWTEFAAIFPVANSAEDPE